MRTAIDTNILSALWSGEPAGSGVVRQLGEAKRQGALLISPVAYAELLAYPKATQAFIDSFLSGTGIIADFRMEEAVWRDAGTRFGRYAALRRKSGQGEAKRLLADFLIGSHALVQADRLLSLDAARFRQYFPELILV